MHRVLVSSILLSACSPASPSAENATPPLSSSPSTSARPTIATAPTASASSESPPESAAPAAVPYPAGSTKGTIACGATRCKAPEEACQWNDMTGEQGCVLVASVEPPIEFLSRCDDGLDCPRGETCCWRWNDIRGSACVARSQVAKECRAELCILDGARCPNETTCVTDGSPRGACEARSGPATCRDQKRCPEDKPVCVISATGPVCAAEGSPDYTAVKGDQRYACTRQSDCNGGESCSFAFGESENETATFCSKYQRGFMGNLVCDARVKSAQCVASRPALPWLGTEVW